jgi:dienelactone hydrolase
MGVRGGDQLGIVGFGHGAALALAAAVHAHPVEQAAARAGLYPRGQGSLAEAVA